MLKVIITKGLPASGKTTWAKKMLEDYVGSYKRVNKDDLRAMFDNGKHSKSNEEFVLKIRDSIILAAIKDGKNVIVDDTNLAPKHERRIKELIRGIAELEVADFTHVPLDVCVARDAKRSSYVGEKVIRNMHKQFLLKTEVYQEDDTLPKAIIVDIDGTLAKMNGRSPFDWSRVKEDYCNEVIKKIVNNYEGKVILFSGRDSICAQETIEWLDENGIFFDGLFMRAQGNIEKDSIVKRNLFEENVRGKYFVEYVLDDRNQVVEMWRNMGLTCLQVADGDF